jgi:hypothetical protein
MQAAATPTSAGSATTVCARAAASSRAVPCAGPRLGEGEVEELAAVRPLAPLRRAAPCQHPGPRFDRRVPVPPRRRGASGPGQSCTIGAGLEFSPTPPAAVLCVCHHGIWRRMPRWSDVSGTGQRPARSARRPRPSRPRAPGPGGARQQGRAALETKWRGGSDRWCVYIQPSAVDTAAYRVAEVSIQRVHKAAGRARSLERGTTCVVYLGKNHSLPGF